MKREVKVGVFAVAVLLAAWFGARFLKGSELFSNNYNYYAYYDQVGGIQTASHVMIYGVKVGSVTSVTLNDDPTKGVELELSIDKRYRIPSDSKARIFSNGVMGGKAIDIVMGSSPQYIEDGGTLASEVGVDIIDMAGSELEFFKEKITEVVGSLTTTLDGINALLNENAESLNNIVANVDGITASTDEILREQKVHLSEAIESLNIFAQSLGNNAGHIDTIMTNLDSISTRLAEADLVSEVEQTIGHLNTMLAAAEADTGTVGKLLNDAALYDNLSAASDNLSMLLADLKENPKRYVHFSLFGSNPDRQAERAAKREAKREAKAARNGDVAVADTVETVDVAAVPEAAETAETVETAVSAGDADAAGAAETVEEAKGADAVEAADTSAVKSN